MTREEMIKRMKEANQDGRSKLSMRSESIQKGFSLKRIPTLKKGLKKKSKLLIVCELAIPFNPETGQEDDLFNVDNKYRPPFSATTVALSLKELADSNECAKKEFMRRAGVEQWDTSDFTQFTKEDWEVFAKYRVPRIFTVPVVHVNIPAITGNDFGRDYAISIERDPMTGDVIGETPAILKIDKLFRDKIYEEIKEFDGKVQSGELKLTDKQISDAKRDIYSKNPVSSDRPSNWVMMVELPMDSKYKLNSDVDYANLDSKTIKNNIVISRISSSLKSAMESYRNGDWEKFDKYFDYFVTDMNCPQEGDEGTPNGKMLIGKDTAFEKPTNDFDECLDEQNVHILQSSISECLDDYLDVEEEVRRSMYITPYTEELESKLYAALPSVLDVEHDRYLTQAVLNANRDVIALAFAEEGEELLDAVDAGVSDAAEGVLDEEESVAAGKKYTLEALNETTVEVDEVVFD